ncbi:MAG TPA: hypothetical protein PK971_04920 [Saprospiraceae bacterium]|nr:hypothetical protein [Saprospiraceae bacterium]HND87646.1 hypothetical protein [Saprospiraceae bacterium]HNG89328.1 hypothetical protein [Saprospiraceae bacterium]
MNVNLFLPSLWRFIGIVALQGLLFKQVALSGSHLTVLLYPLVILLLPLSTPTPYLVIVGCLTGFMVDVFYDSYGVHASAGAFAGLIRTAMIGIFTPKGFNMQKEPIFSPAHVGWQTYVQAAALFFALHIFWYFAVDAFSFVYFGTITIKSAACWGLSMIFVVLYTALFNPKE